MTAEGYCYIIPLTDLQNMIYTGHRSFHPCAVDMTYWPSWCCHLHWVSHSHPSLLTFPCRTPPQGCVVTCPAYFALQCSTPPSTTYPFPVPFWLAYPSQSHYVLPHPHFAVPLCLAPPTLPSPIMSCPTHPSQSFCLVTPFPIPFCLTNQPPFPAPFCLAPTLPNPILFGPAPPFLVPFALSHTSQSCSALPNPVQSHCFTTLLPIHLILHDPTLPCMSLPCPACLPPCKSPPYLACLHPTLHWQACYAPL